VQIEPGKLLVSTFWSASAGLPDKPENYKTIGYEMSGADGGTRLTITQDNNDTQDEADHSAQNWKMVLDLMKKLLKGEKKCEKRPLRCAQRRGRFCLIMVSGL